MPSEALLIHCHNCNARVQLEVAKVLSRVRFDEDTHDALDGARVSLGACAVCKSILVGVQKFLECEVVAQFGKRMRRGNDRGKSLARSGIAIVCINSNEHPRISNRSHCVFELRSEYGERGNVRALS